VKTVAGVFTSSEEAREVFRTLRSMGFAEDKLSVLLPWEAEDAGLQAALHARTRGKEYDQVLNEMAQDMEDLERQYPGSDVEEPFRRGYERGRAHFEATRGRAALHATRH